MNMRAAFRLGTPAKKSVARVGLGALSVAMILAKPLSAVPAEELVRPGMWEISSTMELPGNAQAHPEDRHTHCFTKVEVAGINAKKEAMMTTTESSPADRNCTVKDLKYEGNRATWNTVCGSEIAVHSDLVFHGDSLEGVVSTGAGDDVVKVTMKAKRTGDCD
jgi:Protein of unknown function (DUF3617)